MNNIKKKKWTHLEGGGRELRKEDELICFELNCEKGQGFGANL